MFERISMVKRTTWITALVILIPLYSASGQYAFDIKTTVEEKYDLHVAKEGVTAAFEEAPWASVREVGEDYSLWLTDFRRSHEGDSVRVRMTVNLRTPAMLTRGNSIAARRIEASYHWKKATAYAQDSLNVENMPSQGQIDLEEMGSDLGNMIGLFASISGMPMFGIEQVAGPASGALIGNLSGSLFSILNQEPSPVKIMESILIGRQVVEVTRNMIENEVR